MSPNPWPTPCPTPRLRLRHWTMADLQPFQAMNADPRVMAFFPAPLDDAASATLLKRFMQGIDTCGFGFWALELRESSRFIGFVGLGVPTFAAPFTPCVEIGWRLAYDAWGQGYANEAARSVLDFAFQRLKFAEVVSFTARANLRSQRLMQRLGMLRDSDGDFDHPALDVDSPLRRHVLYRLGRGAWLAARQDELAVYKVLHAS